MISDPMWYGDSEFKPKTGDPVRFGFGKTALAILGEPHAGGWHGRHCMGGTTFIARAAPVNAVDRAVWAANANWRDEVPEQTVRTIKDVPFTDTPVAAKQPELIHQKLKTDSDDWRQKIEANRTYYVMDESLFEAWKLDTLTYGLIACVLSAGIGALIASIIIHRVN